MTEHRSIGAALEASGVGTTALDVRKDLQNLFVRPGLLPGSTDPVVVGTSGFAYRVRRCGLVTQTGPSDGYHLWGNDGDRDITTSDTGAALTAPSSGLSRIDIIYARHPSRGDLSDSTSTPVLAVAKGTAQAVPAAPTIPTGAVELARNTMTSAATSTLSSGNTIEQKIPFTATAGGVVHCRTQGELDALKTLASAANPLLAELAGVLYRCNDATTWTVVDAAMVLIRPTSVAGTGVTLSGGQVSFTGSSAVNVNGCFTTEFDRYVIEIEAVASGETTTRMRLRASGTDRTGTDYPTGLQIQSGSSMSAYSGTDSNWALSAGNGVNHSETVKVINPAAAATTRARWETLSVTAAGAVSAVDGGGQQNVAAASDGFTYYPNAGTVTGKLRVYGLRNS